MALTMKQTSLIVASLGVISFILGVVAENKKPPSGIPIPGKDVVVCQYPSDPTVYLGYMSVIFLILSGVMGFYSLFYPYNGKSIPRATLFESNTLVVFFNLSLYLTGLGLTLLLHPTITEQLHQFRKVHRDLDTECPNVKTGVLGGGAFLSLDSMLFWLLTLMLVNNAREDYFGDSDKADKYDHESLVSL